jgi:hypothetical protein
LRLSETGHRRRFFQSKLLSGTLDSRVPRNRDGASTNVSSLGYLLIVNYPLQGISIWLGINSFEPHFPEEEEEPLWCSSELDDRGVDVREGPAFFAASDGVRWWRDRGAEGRSRNPVDSPV